MTIRLLLLTRYGEGSEEAADAVQAIAAAMWPNANVVVEDAGSAFKAHRGAFGGSFEGWIRFAASDVSAAGPTYHAVAVLSDTVGHASGQIVQMGAAHGRLAYRFNLASNTWAVVRGVSPVDGSARHDWAVLL
jgi:NADP-dependent 3-hydroxy acid dehydrogenase YdfG